MISEADVMRQILRGFCQTVWFLRTLPVFSQSNGKGAAAAA
jgi:hypothetical protein